MRPHDTCLIHTRSSAAPTVVDVAIVGLGVAGASVACGLKEDPAAKSLRVLAYEAASHVGGRLQTAHIPRIGDAANVGGMRYNDERHQRVVAALRASLVRTHPFDVGERTTLRLRGGHTLADLDTAYRVKGVLARITAPDDLIRYALLAILARVEFPTLSGRVHDEALRLVAQTQEALDLLRARPAPIPPACWEPVRAYACVRLEASADPVPLADIGFAVLLQRLLGSEGYARIRDGLGFDSVVSNWNAAEAVAWFAEDFGADATWMTPRGGFQALPELLVRRFQAAGGEVRLGHRLIHIEHARDGSWRLRFEPAADLGTRRAGRATEVVAMNVVLALPPKALLALSVGYAGWDRAFKEEALAAVTEHRMFKSVMVFGETWWDSAQREMPGFRRGRVITDEPLRQIYYFGAPDSSTPTTELPTIMAYSDEQHVDVWAPYLHPAHAARWEAEREEQIAAYAGFFAAEGNHLSDTELAALRALKPLLMPRLMLDDMRTLLAHVHDCAPGDIPTPLLGVCKAWGTDMDTPGGWHSWNVGTRSGPLIERMVQPFPAERLFIAGEAYSRQQAWVEGALESADAVLARLKRLSVEEPADRADVPELRGTTCAS